MNLHSLVQAISGIIPGGISSQDFAAVAHIGPAEAKKIIHYLAKNNIGTIHDGTSISFGRGDKLRTALHALRQGALIDEVSEHLGWRDFEGLVDEILQERNFGTIRNLILKKPRMEIDVVGIKLGVAMLIDCKHWKKTAGSSALESAVKKQIARTRHYVAQTHGAVAVPCIVTLYHDTVDFIQRVPIIPIGQFQSFVDEFYGNLDQLKTIKA